jgi:hypothetical protein
VRALSLTQPWATLVAIGAKRNETRSWRTTYRGPLAIHATQTIPHYAVDAMSRDPFASVLERAGYRGERRTKTLPTGAIVAVAQLVDIKVTDEFYGPSPSPGVTKILLTFQEYEFGDYGPERYAWLLQHAIPLRHPVPCRGRQGLWIVPPDVERRVRETEVA